MERSMMEVTARDINLTDRVMQRTHVIDFEENNTFKMEHLEHVDSR